MWGMRTRLWPEFTVHRRLLGCPPTNSYAALHHLATPVGELHMNTTPAVPASTCLLNYCRQFLRCSDHSCLVLATAATIDSTPTKDPCKVTFHRQLASFATRTFDFMDGTRNIRPLLPIYSLTTSRSLCPKARR